MALPALAKGLLLAVGSLLGLFVALFVGMAAWSWQSSRAALEAAEAFCARVELGEPIAAVAGRASRQGADCLPASAASEGRHRVRFTGWGSGYCELSTTADKVVGKRVFFEEYD